MERDYTSKAYEMEKEIKALAFQVDTHRYREIARYTAMKIQRVILEIEETHKINLSGEYHMWKTTEREIENYG
jgi:hypothetical protein